MRLLFFISLLLLTGCGCGYDCGPDTPHDANDQPLHCADPVLCKQ